LTAREALVARRPGPGTRVRSSKAPIRSVHAGAITRGLAGPSRGRMSRPPHGRCGAEALPGKRRAALNGRRLLPGRGPAGGETSPTELPRRSIKTRIGGMMRRAGRGVVPGRPILRPTGGWPRTWKLKVWHDMCGSHEEWPRKCETKEGARKEAGRPLAAVGPPSATRSDRADATAGSLWSCVGPDDCSARVGHCTNRPARRGGPICCHSPKARARVAVASGVACWLLIHSRRQGP
jgi:hypothetical protein